MQTEARVGPSAFNLQREFPFSLRLSDFQIAMEDVYDFFFDVNTFFLERGLPRLEDFLRSANLSGLLSDMLTASIAKHSRSLVQNTYHNGHPDLLLRGLHPENSAKAGDAGVEIKTTGKKGGAVDTHGGRNQWMCVFVYEVDRLTEPATDRRSLNFTEVYLSYVEVSDFRKNARGDLGTRTATLHREGVKKLRADWVYKLDAA